jgi:hypothetical protein
MSFSLQKAVKVPGLYLVKPQYDRKQDVVKKASKRRKKASKKGKKRL